MSRTITTLGIDQSLSSTGLVVLKNGLPKAHKLTKTNSKWEHERSIHEVLRIVDSALLHFLPDLTLMEDYAYNRGQRSATVLHELGGVIKQGLWRASVPWKSIAPSEVKKFATGKGTATKEEMIEAAQAEWPKCPNQTDIADAYWLARMAHDGYDIYVRENAV